MNLSCNGERCRSHNWPPSSRYPQGTTRERDLTDMITGMWLLIIGTAVLTALMVRGVIRDVTDR